MGRADPERGEQQRLLLEAAHEVEEGRTAGGERTRVVTAACVHTCVVSSSVQAHCRGLHHTPRQILPTVASERRGSPGWLGCNSLYFGDHLV